MQEYEKTEPSRVTTFTTYATPLEIVSVLVLSMALHELWGASNVVVTHVLPAASGRSCPPTKKSTRIPLPEPTFRNVRLRVVVEVQS